MTSSRRPSRLAEELHQTKPFKSPAHEASIALLRTADRVRRNLARAVESEDITLQQYNVLRILRGARGKPLSALEIGQRLIEETPGVSRLVDRLVAKGLVRRERAVADRRLLECFLTDSGALLLRRLDDAVDRADAELVAPLGPRRIAALLDLLERVRAE